MDRVLDVPARQDDFPNDAALRQKLLAIWNDSSPNGEFLGASTKSAACLSENYVDPRIESPAGTAVPVAWNGFPKLLSRWYRDSLSDAAKGTAEVTADIPTPIVYWFDSDDDESPNSIPAHWLPHYASVRDETGKLVFPGARLAAAPRLVNANGTLGASVTHLRRQQDEYLEWHAVHDTQGRLTKLIFTAEAPDYWNALARTAQQASSGHLLDLYRNLVGPEVEASHLLHQTDLAVPVPGTGGNRSWKRWNVQGNYDVLNRWTTQNGIVHLTHAANTLGAEVRLAADASQLWASDKAQDQGPDALEIRRIACGAYGGINRSSDPLIGDGVGKAIVDGNRITLTDPVGLYIADVGIDGLAGPNGEAVGRSALRVLRGTSDAFEPRILRFEVELPAGTPFRLDDCVIDGRKLKRGGQIARKVTMQLYANAYPNSTRPQMRARPCQRSVCRNPDNPDLFIGGSFEENGSPRCPAASHLAWLTQTPFEGVPPPGPGPLAARGLAAEVAVLPPRTGQNAPPNIARSRAGIGV